MGPTPAHRAAFFASFMIAGSVHVRLCLREAGGRGNSLFHQQIELRKPSPGSRPRAENWAVDQARRQGPAVPTQGGQRRQRHLQDRVGWEVGTDHLPGRACCVPDCLCTPGVSLSLAGNEALLNPNFRLPSQTVTGGCPAPAPCQPGATCWDRGFSRYSCVSQ